MGKIAAIVALVFVVSLASAQTNWQAKPSITKETYATVAWDTTWLNQQFDMVWNGFIYNQGTDTLKVQPLRLGTADTTTGTFNIPPSYSLEGIVVGKGFRTKCKTGTSIKWSAKFN